MKLLRLCILALLILPACRRGPVLPDFFSPDDAVFADWWKVTGFFTNEKEERLTVHAMIQHSGTSDGEVIQFRAWIIGDQQEGKAFYQSGAVQRSREDRFPVNMWAQIREDYRLRFRFGRRGVKLFFRPNEEGPGYYRIKSDPGNPDIGESGRFGDTDWTPAALTAPDGEYSGHTRVERLRDIPKLMQNHKHMYWFVIRMDNGADLSFGFYTDAEGGNPTPFPMFKDRVKDLQLLDSGNNGPVTIGFEFEEKLYSCQIHAPMIPHRIGKADTWSGRAELAGESGLGQGFAQYFVR